jgi:predicted RNase H-like HicB family nuclease
MTRYVGILEKEPGSLWGVYFPDLPGCVTAGETAQEALDRAPEALRLWTEDALSSGEALPKARTVEDLRQDSQIAAAMAEGQAAVVLSSELDETLFDEPTLKAIDKAASQRGMSRIAFLRETVLDKIRG